MQKIIIVSLILLAFGISHNTANAERIYMNRDAKGRAVFTDRPQHDSKRVLLPQANVAQPIVDSSGYSANTSSSAQFTSINKAGSGNTGSRMRRRSCGG